MSAGSPARGRLPLPLRRARAAGVRTALTTASTTVIATTLWLAVVWTPTPAHAWGLEYSREFHHGVIDRRRAPNDALGPGSVLQFDAQMHRVSLVDTSGALLAGLAGGSARHLAKRKAVRKWFREGAHSDTITYSYASFAAVPGIQTRLSFAWGADISNLTERRHAVALPVPRPSQELWSLEVLVEYTSVSILPRDRLFFVLSSDIWWKTIAVRSLDPTPKADWEVVGESMLGIVFNGEIGSMITPWLRVIGYAGWDPIVGSLALLQDASASPDHNWQYGLKADVALGPWFQIAVNWGMFGGGLRFGDNARRYNAQLLQVRVGGHLP